VEIEGLVTAFTDRDNFEVSGVTIDASTAEFEPSALANTLAIGDRVEVEGDIQNEVLIAEEVKGRGGNIRIEAFVDSRVVGTGQVTLELAPGRMVTIETSASTVYQDDRDEVSNFGLDDLQEGDYVRIQADQATSITANEIKRKGREDKIKITAVVGLTDPMAETITLLGVTFATNGGGDTEFEQDAESGDMPLTSGQFFSNAGVVARTAVITIEDELEPPDTGTVGDGTANEVEIKD